MSFRRNNFRLAYRSLKASKARSFLTMLGIIIGVFAVVMVICIGEGVKHQISHQVDRYGKNVLTVRPVSQGIGGGLLGDSLSSASSSLLGPNDLQLVQHTSGIATAVPLSAASGSMTGDRTVTAPFIVATSTDFPDVINQSFQAGGFFDSDTDTESVVLGESVAHKLFYDDSPLGEALTWRGHHFIVAGVFDNFKAPPFSLEANFNNAVFVPYATAQKLNGGILGIYQILAKSTTVENARHVANATQSALVAARGGADDVTVQVAGDNNDGSDQTIHLLTMLVGGVALIALIVGGVGIMNIMLVSVTERMHEIGLRKAIGATNRQIMRQFMAEAFIVTVGGALIGLVLSAIAVGLLRAFTSLQPILVWQAFVGAPIAAVAIGMFFGSMPAFKAARKDPIEALRHQ